MVDLIGQISYTGHTPANNTHSRFKCVVVLYGLRGKTALLYYWDCVEDCVECDFDGVCVCVCVCVPSWVSVVHNEISTHRH